MHSANPDALRLISTMGRDIEILLSREKLLMHNARKKGCIRKLDTMKHKARVEHHKLLWRPTPTVHNKLT